MKVGPTAVKRVGGWKIIEERDEEEGKTAYMIEKYEPSTCNVPQRGAPSAQPTSGARAEERGDEHEDE